MHEPPGGSGASDRIYEEEIDSIWMPVRQRPFTSVPKATTKNANFYSPHVPQNTIIFLKTVQRILQVFFFFFFFFLLDREDNKKEKKSERTFYGIRNVKSLLMGSIGNYFSGLKVSQG